MSIMFLSSSDYSSGKIIEYNIASSKDDKNKDIKAINDELVFQEEMTFGKIYKRKDNGDLWYIDFTETIARFITTDQLELFHKWAKQSLLPTDKEFETLKQIGGLASSKYSWHPNNIQFPARVVTHTGEQIDLCLFHFSQAPPFQRYFKKVLLLSDIAEIRPSELSLSYELRCASTHVSEIRMAFSPFMVKTNRGELLTYNGSTQFASTGEIKGSDISSEVKFSYDRFEGKINGVSFDDITFIIGKWDSRLEEVFNRYRIEQEKESNTKPIKYTFWDRIYEKILNFLSR